MKNDIESLKEIQFLVDSFYSAVQKDILLGPIFNSKLQGKWEIHHRKLYRFWNTVLLRRPDYYGDPVPLHFNLSIDETHFDHWLELWIRTVEENFEGKIAERAKYRARTMATSFISRIKKEQKSLR